jgi:tetratricopeptide (TPR) repeat protein
MHPLLGGYLTSEFLPKLTPKGQEPLIRAFVQVNASMADDITFMEATQKHQAYYFLGASLRSALSNAFSHGSPINVGGLMQCLAALAQNARDFETARELYEEVAAHAANIRFPQAEASARYQLGRIADVQGDFATAESKYRLALALFEQAGDLKEVAHTYNTIGHCAAQQEKYQLAEDRKIPPSSSGAGG